MIRNLAGQSAGAQMISASTGAAFVGTVTVYVTLDAGVQVIGSVGSGICTAEGNGYFSYRPSQEETDAAVCVFTFIGSGAIPASIQYPTITQAQQAAIVGSSVAGAVSVEAICADAALELNIIMAGGTLTANQASVILGKLNRLFDNWNADKSTIYSVDLTTYTLTTGLNPQTIGPSSATFTVSQRPNRIEAANLVLTGSPDDIHLPLYIERDPEVWARWPIPTLASSVPTTMFYNPTWPNGSLYLDYVPDTAYGVELLTLGTLAQVDLTDTVTLPPGYLDAIILTLAEEIATPFDRVIPQKLESSARKARARIMANNDVIPRLITAQGGMPGNTGRTRRGSYLTGWWG